MGWWNPYHGSLKVAHLSLSTMKLGFKAKELGWNRD
jgi:hypothetical protein